MKKTDNLVEQKAKVLANLMFRLLPKCQQKEIWLADKNNLLNAELKCIQLFEIDKKLSNKFVAERLNMSQSRSTRIIDGLVNKNYLLREKDSEDRRNVSVTLSRQGKVLANKLNKEYVSVHLEILNGIDDSQHESLITALEKLNSAIELWLQRPRISYLNRRVSTN